MRRFISNSLICNVIKALLKRLFSTARQWVFIASQIGELEVDIRITRIPFVCRFWYKKYSNT